MHIFNSREKAREQPAHGWEIAWGTASKQSGEQPANSQEIVGGTADDF
jgi:hypothetical protein